MQFFTAVDDALVERIAAVAREAGAIAFSYFRSGARTSAQVDWKNDGGSPVTEADFAVDRFLREALPPLAPGAGWLSEETADTPARLDQRALFVVDPIDGTRGFMDGDPRFAVSIALVVDGAPVAALLEAPATGETFSARAGGGAFRNGVRLERAPADAPAGAQPKLAGPKFLVDDAARRLGMAAQPKIPSLALRFAYVAAGVYDAAVASANAHDWDVAAADLILAEAGCGLRDLQGDALRYNREETKHGVLVAAPPALDAPLREAVSGVVETWRRKRGS